MKFPALEGNVEIYFKFTAVRYSYVMLSMTVGETGTQDTASYSLVPATSHELMLSVKLN